MTITINSFDCSLFHRTLIWLVKRLVVVLFFDVLLLLMFELFICWLGSFLFSFMFRFRFVYTLKNVVGTVKYKNHSYSQYCILCQWFGPSNCHVFDSQWNAKLHKSKTYWKAQHFIHITLDGYGQAKKKISNFGSSNPSHKSILLKMSASTREKGKELIVVVVWRLQSFTKHIERMHKTFDKWLLHQTCRNI